MISNLIRYSFVGTRARGMVANFLKAEDYQQLLRSQSLQEFEKGLRKLYPSQSASGPSKQALSHDAPHLEGKILEHFLDIARKIKRSLPEAEEAYLNAILSEYEIFNIKALLRGRILGTPTDKIRLQLIALGNAAQWDWEELLAEDEIPEILRVLRMHPLGARISKIYVEKYLKTHSLFLLESQIDIEYLIWLYDGARQFGKEEAVLLRKLIGQRIDALNVRWIVRFKENFKMSPEEIMVQLVPRGRFLDVAALKNLAFAEDPKFLLALLRNYPWRKYLPADKLGLEALESGLDRYLKDQCYRIFHYAPLHLAGVVAFALLAQSVAQDLVKILEATEYRLSAEEVEPQLYFVNR